MGPAERRIQIIKILCRRRFATMDNLASELGVSSRTIFRDINILSLTEPIFTQKGRYGGGIYIDGSYVMNRMYMSEHELFVLNKLKKIAENQEICILSLNEKKVLYSIIELYTKPYRRKE